MWKLDSAPVIVPVTRKLAEEFRNMTPCPGDRPLNEPRVARLTAVMRTGMFRNCEWVSTICKETGETYRVNGKHTSHAICEMDGNPPSGVRILVVRYVCDTCEDVAQLYGTFDTKESLRSTNDINHSFASTDKDLADIPRKIINLAVTGIGLGKADMIVSIFDARSSANRAADMLPNKDFVRWLAALICGDNPGMNHLRRAAVAAACYMTYQKSRDSASDFWRLVRDGERTRDTPDRMLYDLLVRTRVQGGRGIRTMARRDMFVVCVKAWNAWRGKKNIGMLKVTVNEKLPVIL